MLQQLKGRKLLLVLALPIMPFVLFYGALFGVWGLSAIHNAITLRNFARPFLEYPLPQQTTEVGNSAEWGVLTGNGNHCDFRVTRTLETALSEDEIRAYYRAVGFPAVVQERSSMAAISGREDGLISIVVEVENSQPGFVTISLLDGFYSGTLWDAACR